MSNIYRNLFLVLFSVMAALGFAEIIAAIAGLPQPPLKSHSAPPQFRPHPGSEFGYLNVPSSNIVFIYDGDPRDYFRSGNTVSHQTNKLGFRGPLFPIEKEEGSLRLAFLGDSFTFGEGVHFEDTYAEKSRKLLNTDDHVNVEAFNFGVGGFNTEQEEALLRQFVMQMKPDIVVIGYTMNDAEPRLFFYDEKQKQYKRRVSPIRDGGPTPIPPRNNWLYKTRIGQLIWRALFIREETNNTISWYRSLYKDSNPDWQSTKHAIKSIGEQCSNARIPCISILFPVLFKLDDYPLLEEHTKVKQVFQNNGFTVVDLLPALRAYDANDLWVHPTDHHPNEIVHAIAGEQLVNALHLNNLLP